MKGFSGFPQKETKKRIINATDFVSKSGENIATEQLEPDFDLAAGTGKVKGGSNIVYRKGLKKYVKDYETGEFIEIPRSEIKRLKEEGSYTTKRKIKKQNE